MTAAPSAITRTRQVLTHNTSLAALQGRVRDDPFVAEDVVSAEILEIDPSSADDRLGFLLG